MELLKTSWPFDSDPNVTYDDLGYPILDRAVGADTLQRTFDKFFSDGVFSTSDFRISAASGLSVNIQPGMCIINGGMAGWWDEPKVVALSATAPQWLTHYAIFLRYDNNDDMRGIYLRIDASAAGGSVPEPQSAANVTELRIGYVTVPANATDLSSATFHNEVGTRYAPVTTPLFDIDPVPILEDLRERADAAYQAYYDLLITAVDGTTAGNLQNQINAQSERIDALEENQFTEDDIDPQALRKEMGLGDTLGVLPESSGGTNATDFMLALANKGMWIRGTSTVSGSEGSTDRTVKITPPAGTSLSDWTYFKAVIYGIRGSYYGFVRILPIKISRIGEDHSGIYDYYNQSFTYGSTAAFLTASTIKKNSGNIVISNLGSYFASGGLITNAEIVVTAEFSK